MSARLTVERCRKSARKRFTPVTRTSLLFRVAVLIGRKLSFPVLSLMLLLAGQMLVRGNPGAGESSAVVMYTPIEVSCKGNTHRLAFVSATDRLRDQRTARALGVALIPLQGAVERLFCVYWFGNEQGNPNRRDNDDGSLGDKLFNYTPTSIVEFLRQCDFSARMVEEIEDVLSKQDIATVERIAAILKDQLGASGTGSALHLKTGQLDPSIPLKDELSFARALRAFVSEPNTPTNGTEDLNRRISELQDQIGKLQMSLSHSNSQSFPTGTSLVLSGTIILALLLGVLVGYHRGKAAGKGKPPLTPASPVPTTADATVTTQNAERLRAFNAVLDRWQAACKSVGTKPQAKDVFKKLLRDLSSFQTEQLPNLETEDATVALKHLISQYERGFKSVRRDVSKAKSFFSRFVRELQEFRDAHLVSTELPDQEPPRDFSLRITEFDRIFAKLALNPGSAGPFSYLDKLGDALIELRDLCFEEDSESQESPIEEITHKCKESLSLRALLRRRLKTTVEGSNDVLQATQQIIGKIDSISEELWKQSGKENHEQNTPAEILDRIQVVLGEDHRLIDEYTQIKAHYDEAMGLLPPDRPTQSTSLPDRIRVEKERVSFALQAINSALPEPRGDIQAGVSDLIARFKDATSKANEADRMRSTLDELRTQLAAAQDELAHARMLAEEVSRYLHFDLEPPGESPSLSTETDTGLRLDSLCKTIQSEPTENRHLRLRLASALLCFESAIKNCARTDVMQAFLLENISRNLRIFLRKVKNIPADKLWERGLCQGFNDQWLHDLLRADLLTRSYLADNGTNALSTELTLLCDEIQQAAGVVIATLYAFGVQAPRIRLLEPSPNNVRTDDTADPRLLKLPEASTKVLRKHSSGDCKFVVDVGVFPLISNGKPISEGSVVLFSQGEWIDAQPKTSGCDTGRSAESFRQSDSTLSEE